MEKQCNYFVYSGCMITSKAKINSPEGHTLISGLDANGIAFLNNNFVFRMLAHCDIYDIVPIELSKPKMNPLYAFIYASSQVSTANTSNDNSTNNSTSTLAS